MILTAMLSITPLLYAFMDGSGPFYESKAAASGTVFTLNRLDAPNAVCLDGSPGTYYFRPGSGSGATKWYIHHQGGGWCESLDDCLDRSHGSLGSSKGYGNTTTNDYGYFSEVTNKRTY